VARNALLIALPPMFALLFSSFVQLYYLPPPAMLVLGVIFLLLGLTLIVLTVRQGEMGKRKLSFILTGASAAGIPLAAVLHNFVLGRMLFVLALLVLPMLFVTGWAASVVLLATAEKPVTAQRKLLGRSTPLPSQENATGSGLIRRGLAACASALWPTGRFCSDYLCLHYALGTHGRRRSSCIWSVPTNPLHEFRSRSATSPESHRDSFYRRTERTTLAYRMDAGPAHEARPPTCTHCAPALVLQNLRAKSRHRVGITTVLAWHEQCNASANQEVPVHYLIGLVFVLAFGGMGCSETSGAGGSGGLAGTGGGAGSGGGAAGGSGAGGAVGCTGTPTLGLSVDWALLDGEDPVPVFEDATKGYRVTPGGGNVTFTSDGLGSDEVAPVSLNPGESLTWAFFEEDLGALTAPATVTNLEIWFEKLPGFGVDVTAVDGSGAILGPITVTARRWVDISAIFGEVPLHQVTAAPELGVAQTVTSIPQMRYDHDCL